MAQKEIVTMTMSSLVTYLRIDTSLMNFGLPALFIYSVAQSSQNSREIQCINDVGLSKQCINVKMVVGF